MLQFGTLVNSLGLAGTGINDAVRGVVRTSSGDVEAYVKRLASSREVLVEVACAVMARQLDLPVPQPLLVYVPEHMGGPYVAYGSVAAGNGDLSAFIEGGQLQVILDQLRAWPGLIKAACFDEWIANCDRHERNILYNGIGEFWLIDHGLAVNAALPVDELAPQNILFDVAVRDRAENELLRMRPVALGVMEAFQEKPTSQRDLGLPTGLWPDEEADSVLAWLASRQAHLMRLASERIPAMQSEMFDGHHR
ncbi:TPA: hypothetical protein UM350_004339 [Stenotrophomonas maltophilia]|uniref:HipA family kinase n=1 Tax=Stenotrophomonas maltophilia TaxID=40324 RepID=UPI000C160155|nr:HipA family kinase [Stenotrophomonas maltophilia]MBA0331614.1 hypothetical protein [Stenotrophomonas maltophilia]MBN5120312.1 hypothetical protein [Stenotrophomonas maltophilia]MBO3001980.1 hypothetical protein [Stenotrophomonas maltophilia]MBP1382138.1 hypothetical protein [Stenotrophomonas maltophilia]MBP1387027.1 hypothetical protein [Stenotrophomonas maltophilia]